MLAAAPEALLDTLEYRRCAILEGEVWRLWSAHFVHYSATQAAADVGTLALSLLVGPPFISAGLLGMGASLEVYRGASGLAVMFAVQAGCTLHWLLGALLAVKILLAWQDPSTLPNSLEEGIAVAWQVHLLGAVCGCLLGPVFLLLTRGQRARAAVK
ncbi:MAG: hypothetical protein MO853_04510 [Candidatus Protistobacter heckmanni]|nr:hypothetical protein [Candidatus Protistobacter heckmanni]